MKDKIIAVTGATGQQGGAVARKLLAEDWRVRALTRDVDKPAAQELAALGAELVPGDMDNRAELDAAFKGAYGVFSVQNFWLPNVGFDGEIKQGKNVADAAKAAGVQHLVYSSVGAAHRGMGQKHFESKWIIEQYIQSLDLPYTILRPAAFFENFNWERASILNGTFNALGLSFPRFSGQKKSAEKSTLKQENQDGQKELPKLPRSLQIGSVRSVAKG